MNHESEIFHWLAQRVSALALIAALALLAWWFASLPQLDSATLSESLSNRFTAWALALGLSCAYWHASLGVRVIAEDYISSARMRRLVIYACYALLILAWLAVVIALLALTA